MIKNFNNKALILARESRGLTQNELSALIHFPQSSLSRIENGNLGIDGDTLQAIGKALNYPISFFEQEITVYPPNIYYRKKVAIPNKVISIAEAIMNIYRINIQKLLTSVDLPNRKIPYLNEYSGNPKQIASYVRQHWKIPKGPIDNLTKIVEDNGVIVIPIEFPTDKIDGRSMTTEKGDCIIFLNKKLSGDRARYTLAHELGHVIMHLYLPPTAVLNIDDDGEANLFASEFLMPENEIKQHLNGKLTIEKLADLKRIWKTSMQAILVWAERLGKITPRNARFIWQQFGSMGIRLKEPIEIPKEYPTLLREIIDAYTHQLSFTKEDLAEMLCLLPDEFSENFLPQQITLRVERLFSRQ